MNNATLLTADAKNRALRTFLQGLATDVAAALILYLLPIFTGATGWQDLDFKLMGFMVAKTIVVTAFSYVMRKYLDGSGVPTPLPPEPQPEPAAPAA